MRYLLVLLVFTFIVTSGKSQTQTVRGTVLDKVTEKPITGATIRLEPLNLSTTSDSAGHFAFVQIRPGRVQLMISSSGYQPVSIPEVLVTAGKEVVLEAGLEQSIIALKEILVKSEKTKKGNVGNEYAGSSARSFNIDEINRFAGGRNDPSRLVSNFAGVIANNDNRNDIVVRGNTPTGILWRIEGLPSANPNHFSTLGTVGGPVSALNTNALKTSDFYSGAFPAEFGNANAAVFDINLRNGNTQRSERTLQLNLFSGFEAMLEGPIGKNGGNYIAGTRYSFIQIAHALGVNFGTSAIPQYQDWVYNIQSAKTKLGRFSLFGIGGISKINFLGREVDSTDFYARKDEDQYFKSSFSVFGFKHVIDLGKNSYLKTSGSFTHTSSQIESYGYALPVPPYGNSWMTTSGHDNQDIYRISTLFNSRISPKLSIRSGITEELFQLNSRLADRSGKTATAPFDTIRNYGDQFSLLQFYAEGRYRPVDRVAFTAGLHGMNFLFNHTHSLEPRASLQYQPDNKQTLQLSFGAHSQIQPFPIYLYEHTYAMGIHVNNRNLDFTKSNHYVLGYEYRFATDWRAKVELYYQYLHHIPVEPFASGFSVINAGDNFNFPEKAGLVNAGTASNKGIEVTIEKFLSKGFYLLNTTSLFKSLYRGSDGIERSSSFNYGYVTNVLAGREWKTGKEKQNAFTVDLRFALVGGKYTTPIDLNESIAQGKEVLDETRYNSERLADYLRLDTKFGFRLNSKKSKLSQIIYLDLQNVTNRRNIFLRHFNPVYGSVSNLYQVGFFPDLLYRVEF